MGLFFSKTVKSVFFTTGFIIFLGSIVNAEEPNPSASLTDAIKVSLYHKPFADFSRSEQDLATSFIDTKVTLSNNEYLVGRELIVLDVRLSLVPLLMKERTKEELYEAVDKKLDAVLTPQNYPTLPPAVLKGLKLKKTKEAREILDDRLDQIEEETILQRLAIAYEVEGGKNDGLKLSIGKAPVHVGGNADDNNETFEESFRPSNDSVVRAGNTAGTGRLAAGKKVKFSDGSTLKGQVFVFADRTPFVSGSQYIGTVANMTEQEYRDHKDWADLNSIAFRVSSNIKGIEASASYGTYNGDDAVTGSIRVPLVPSKLSLSVSGYSGSRKNLEKGLSAQLTYSVTENFTTYIRGTSAKDEFDPINGDEDSYTQKAVGVSYKQKVAKQATAGVMAEGTLGGVNQDNDEAGGFLGAAVEVNF